VLYDRKQLDAPRNEIFWSAKEKIIIQEVRNVHLHKRIVAAFDDMELIALNTSPYAVRDLTKERERSKSKII
jgi:hypothetical protein